MSKKDGLTCGRLRLPLDANLQKDDEAAHLQTAEEAIEQDAQGYARATGIAIEGASYSSAGTCNFYYYMPIEFLPSGWSLLLG